MCPISRKTLVPYGISRSWVQTSPVTESENTPQPGHPDAVSSAVDQVRHPAAERVRLDPVDRKAARIEQTPGVRYRILSNMANAPSLGQARGFSLIRNCL
jgi:hypothetical protein